MSRFQTRSSQKYSFRTSFANEKSRTGPDLHNGAVRLDIKCIIKFALFKLAQSTIKKMSLDGAVKMKIFIAQKQLFFLFLRCNKIFTF